MNKKLSEIDLSSREFPCDGHDIITTSSGNGYHHCTNELLGRSKMNADTLVIFLRGNVIEMFH